jgi:hypothetical protein
MMGCALILLFVLGVCLLIEPLKACGTEKVDNVVAAGDYHPVAGLGRQLVIDRTSSEHSEDTTPPRCGLRGKVLFN